VKNSSKSTEKKRWWDEIAQRYNSNAYTILGKKANAIRA